MKVLIYYGRSRTMCWVANSQETINVALSMLFQKLDGEGIYEFFKTGPFYKNFLAARRGDIAQIKAILNMRNGRPNECWEIIYAIDTRQYDLVPAEGVRDHSAKSAIIAKSANHSTTNSNSNKETQPQPHKQPEMLSPKDN